MRTVKFVDLATLPVRVPEKIARELDSRVKEIPQDLRTVKRLSTLTTKSEFEESDFKYDISWITTSEVDMVGDIVLPDAIDRSLYLQNPVVLWQHDDSIPAIGTAAWVEPSEKGLRAKTRYARRPANWEGVWMPDQIHELTKQGVIRGKSIGFIPTEIEEPDREQQQAGVKRVIKSCVMFEYSCCNIPCNSASLVEMVSKGFDGAVLARLGIEVAAPKVKVPFKKKVEAKADERLKAIKELDARVERLLQKMNRLTK